jgi:hypothetical protein
VQDCVKCRDDLAVIRRDADLVGAALSTDSAADVDVPAAWQRLSAAAPRTLPRQATPRPGGRARRLLRRPAAVAAAFAVVLGGAGTAAANGWLPIFRTEQVTPVTITTADLIALPDLSAYGDISLTTDPGIHSVADAATAESETGLDVPEVADLPGGVSGSPVLQVGGKASATFTFSLAEAAAAAGTATAPPPPGLDGTSVRLDAGPGVVQMWTSESGAPALVVGRAVAPTAFSSGVQFDAVRDYLLSLPGLPVELADQLRTFTADGSTLPLPVPGDEVTTTSAEVRGTPATVLTTRDGLLTAVIWVEDGVVTVVAGSIGSDEALTVARELR